MKQETQQERTEVTEKRFLAPLFLLLLPATIIAGAIAAQEEEMH
jgi:hypothetical protein